MLNLQAPSLLELEVTTRCDLDCPFCYLGSERHITDMPLFEGTQLLAEAKKAGVERIVFTGGECLQYPHIEELVGKANQFGWRPGLLTNGLRIPENFFSRLHNKISFIQLSLHALPTEDERAQAVCEQVLRLRDAGLPITFLVTLSSRNIAKIDKFLNLFVRLGVPAGFQRICALPGKLDYDFSLGVVEYDHVLKTISGWMQSHENLSCEEPLLNLLTPKKYIKDIPNDIWSGCSAGRWAVVISSDGSMLPCAKLRISDRNVFDVGFTAAWQTSELMASLRTVPSEAKCYTCDFCTICRGCRAAAYSATKEIWGNDPLCPKANA